MTDGIQPFVSDVELVQKSFGERGFSIFKVEETDFPELEIVIPDDWENIILAPLYDVHIGSREFDEALFLKHRDWIASTPNIISWNGGDMFENLLDPKMGHTHLSPEEQIAESLKLIAPIQHKLMFALPGNHEDRTAATSGMSSARRLADYLRIPFFSDYCIATIKWRGNTFRLVAHHGAGGGTTPGAQRNAARKELAWLRPDMLWSGHLHQPFVDTVYNTDFDQKTGRMFERSSVVVVSPSYLKFFGGYAAKKRMAPGTRGLTAAILQDDGRIDVNVHARGKRL